MAQGKKKSYKEKMRERVRYYVLPSPRKLRALTPTRAVTKKADFIRALEGTGGIKNEIAKNLGVSRMTVRKLLVRPDWADVREAWEEECENLGDLAVTTIKDMIKQRLDFGTAAGAAKWYLSRVRREQFGDESKTIIEGGKKPLQINQLNANIPIEALDLPIEVKRQIINALDARDEAEKSRELSLPAPASIPGVVSNAISQQEGDEE